MAAYVLKTKTLLYLLLLLTPIAAIAQSDFREGYVVTIQNDTLRGAIEYRSNTKNYTSCRFSRDGEIKELTPQEITSYRYLNDKCFMSGIVEGAFVEVLISGSLDLYMFNSTFFFKKSNNELHKIESQGVAADLVDIKEKAKWKGIVSYLISDCNPDTDVIKSLELDETDLTRLVQKYNECKGEKYVVYKGSKPMTKFEFGFITGVAMTSIAMEKFATGPDLYPYLPDRYTSTNPYAGLLMRVSSPRVTERAAIQSEIHIMQVSYYSGFVANSGGSSSAYSDSYINLTTLSIPLSMVYDVIRNKRVQLHAGFYYDQHLNIAANVREERVSSSNIVTTREFKAFDARKNQVGHWGGLSTELDFKKFGISMTLRHYGLFSSSLSNSLDLNAYSKKNSLSIIIKTK